MTEQPTINFVPLSQARHGQTLICFLPEKASIDHHLSVLNQETGGLLDKAVRISDFKGKRKSIVEFIAPIGVSADRIILVGLGDAKTLTERDWLDLGGTVRGKLHRKALHADVIFDGFDITRSDAASLFSLGFALRNYNFKKYKSKHKTKDSDDFEDLVNDETHTLNVFTNDDDRHRKDYDRNSSLSESVYFARDLVNEPGNILIPPAFVDRLKALENDGVEVEVLDEAALRKHNMNALLAVGQGSAQPSAAVILRWNGKSHDQHTRSGNLVFIGKGVCFDSGGISIKPGAGMEDMKGDMAGAAAVAGAIKTLAQQSAPVNAIGLVGLVENMPSGTAFRPGDVLTAASGQTIEVQNTDAEGRLVLADLIWYAQNFLEPKAMISLATLTGAIIVALGKQNAGLFSNNDNLSEELTQAGLQTGETVWRLPLSKKYDKLIDSKIADMRNIGGREAGSITAAQFLQRFVVDDAPWAHLDIAGTGMASPTNDINHSWGSGFGVRLLEQYARKYYN